MSKEKQSYEPHYNLVRDNKTGREFYAEYSSEAAEWYEKGTGKAYSIDEIEVLESYVHQTDVPAEESDADKAAEEAARAYGHKADKDGIGGDDYEDDIEIAFKAGIAWERERMMKEAVDGEVVSDLKNVNHVRTMSKIPGTLYFGEKVSVIIIKKEK